MNWLQLANGFFFPPFCTCLCALVSARVTRTGWHDKFWTILPWAAGGGIVGGFIPPPSWEYQIGSAFWLLVWLWHRRRDQRKRAAAWLGAKSRALRDALVRKAREVAQPRPVLRPVPG